MPEIICVDCGQRIFHENKDTLKIQENIHKKFCRKKEGDTASYMHREGGDQPVIDPERENDLQGKPVIKR